MFDIKFTFFFPQNLSSTVCYFTEAVCETYETVRKRLVGKTTSVTTRFPFREMFEDGEALLHLKALACLVFRRIKTIINKFEVNMDVELQQRGVEFGSLFGKHESMR